ncbi:MAG: hypothetical protein IJW46_08000 [Clostridia bacterium]|nr:hypothetical protein [Clostridia bacterium]
MKEKNVHYIGLSTHRRIAPEAIGKVEAAARSLLHKLKEEAIRENQELVMLNSLAEGGDTMLAKLALSLNIPYIAILPREKASYAEDFEGEALCDFLTLCDQANAIAVTPNIEGDDRLDYDYFYRQAGIFVAARSDTFLALWDGVPGKPDGCGAAEAYAFAQSAAYADPTGGYPLKSRTLYHILTPRPTQDTARAGEITVTKITV